MKEIDEFLKYSKLFSIYKELLSKKQKMYMEAYFEEDNSFAEIADYLNISRQAVFDNIKKACIKLEKYENALGIIKKEQEYMKQLDSLKNNFTESNLDNIIKEIRGY